MFSPSVMAAKVAEVIRKRKAGEQLSTEEHALYNSKQQASLRRSKRIYFPDEETLEQFQRKCTESGATSFSAWIVNRVVQSTEGHFVEPGELERLHAQLEEAKEDFERERRKAEQFREERDLEREKLADLTERMISVMEGLGIPPGGS